MNINANGVKKDGDRVVEVGGLTLVATDDSERDLLAEMLDDVLHGRRPSIYLHGDRDTVVIEDSSEQITRSEDAHGG